MDEFNEELRDVRREIIESRGLIIKTNNLTNALSADLKSIAKRQQNHERRAFWNSSVATGIFVVVVLGVVKLAWDARVESVEHETRQARARVQQLEGELLTLKQASEARSRGEAAAATFYELIRSGKEKEMIEVWDSVRQEKLTRAEQSFFQDRVAAAKSQLSLGAYHAGLESVRVGRWHQAVVAFEESLCFDDGGAHAPSAQLNLAQGYRRLNRQRDAIPILVKLSEASPDPEILDDALYLLSQCLIDIQAWNDAKTALRNFIRRYPRSPFINEAKMALADLSLKR